MSEQRALYKGKAKITKAKEASIHANKIFFARTERMLKSLASAWAGNRDFTIEVEKLY